jgi:glycosyltransferase involved in cell wall biosynthesis
LYKYTIEAKSKIKKWLVYVAALGPILKRADAVHFTTKHELDGFQRYFGYLPHYFLQPNGFDLTSFNKLPNPGSFLSRFPELTGKRIVLFLGRITEKKGLDLLIEAFSALASEFPDTVLVIAGPCENPPFLYRIKSLIEKKSITARVIFTGMLEGELRFAAFVDSHLFVLSSYSENFGMAVVEAMLCGLPVVVSKEVGVSDFVEEEKVGLVVSTDPASVEGAIRTILTDPHLRRRLSVAGALAAKRRFSHTDVGERLASYYQKIVSRRRNRSESIT